MEERMRFVVVVIIALIIVLLIGCAPLVYMPVAGNNVERVGEYAMLRLDESLLIAAVDLWIIEPRFLPDYFTTIHIRVQNRTNHSMTINPSDFAIIDEYITQTDVIAPEVVLEMMLADPSLIPERYIIAADTQREHAQRMNAIRRNILTRGFSFGEIHPGAFKEGILFFPRLPTRNMEFTLVYKGNEIGFKRGR